jgi:uncharacterized membrane protein
MPNGPYYDRQGRGRTPERDSGLSALAAGAVVLASGALAFAAVSQFARSAGMMRDTRPSWPEDAPRRTLHENRGSWRGPIVVGRTVTINKPRAELYAFWRDFTNLPTFMENVKAVEVTGTGQHSRWTIAAPGEDITFESAIVDERENELIAWRSSPDAPVQNAGRVVFRDAPGGRGTQVEATIAYEAPGGRIGQAIAKLFQREPHIQARRELKRFKQLMETGEISTTVPGKAAPRAA